MSNKFAVILAAGKGTRMRSKLPKILHSVCDKPMVQHIVDQMSKLSFQNIVTIVGHDADRVKQDIKGDISFITQEEQLGTAHAVQQAAPLLSDKEGTTVVLTGDTPLITDATVSNLLQEHEDQGAAATVLTAVVDAPTGYGRIIRNEVGHVVDIVEEKDADVATKEINEVNTGIFCFDNQKLFNALQKVNNDNVQGEYYLPDVISILQQQKDTIAAAKAQDVKETLGINDRVALSHAESIMKRRINEHHMRQGVTILDGDNTYISSDAVIGSDTVIKPGSHISGAVTIGNDCVIGPNTQIKNAEIGDQTTIDQSVVTDSKIGHAVNIGPFVHIRPDSEIGDQVKLGNFVEVKKSKIGKGSKASHLSYVGDADIGSDVNLSCGSITVNYDGSQKHLTKVEDGAFIGCNVNLVAPVTVGKGAFVAAGSTITDDVQTEALAIARSRQTNKENYAQKLTQKKK